MGEWGLALPLLIFRQLKPKLNASRQIFSPIRAIVHGNDALDDIKPQPCMGKPIFLPFWLPFIPVIATPDMLQILLWNLPSFIIDADTDVWFLFL